MDGFVTKGNVFANTRSVVHKGDSLTNVCAIPDVCKTPTPGGPIPIPYINIAFNRNLTKGTKKVRIAGNAIAIAKSKLSTSTGDEPGTLGGIVSGKFKGKMAWGTSSPNVKAEGKGVVRFMDITLHNGNTYNSGWTQIGNVAVTFDAYGDDTQCEVCGKDPATHRSHESKVAEANCTDLINKLSAYAAQVDKKVKGLDGQVSAISEQEKPFNTPYQEQLLSVATDTNNLLQGRGPNAIYQGGTPQEKANLTALANKRKEIQQAQKNDPDLKRLKEEKTRLKAQADALRPKRVYKDYPAGFMIGVLHCKCGAKRFAGMSGSYVTYGFKEVATNAGYQVAQPIKAPSENAELYDDIKSPRLLMATSEEEKAQIRADMKAEYARLKENPEPNSPGRANCAAPKLIQACFNQGHAVGAISEKWFSPEDKDCTVTQDRFEHWKSGSPRSYERTFKHGETVTSCNTCKKELPPMLCDSDQHQC